MLVIKHDKRHPNIKFGTYTAVILYFNQHNILLFKINNNQKLYLYLKKVVIFHKKILSNQNSICIF